LGGDEEAFWGDYFNGFKAGTPGRPRAARAAEGELAARDLRVRDRQWESQINLGRLFMARFGDIARIEANGRDLRVTLKSGTVFHLDRYAANDFADGIRVWDDSAAAWTSTRGGSAPSSSSIPVGRTVPDRLHVRCARGRATSPVLSSGPKGVRRPTNSDGHTAAGERSLRFDTIRSSRATRARALVTPARRPRDLLSTPASRPDNRGDLRRRPALRPLLVSWGSV